MTVTEYDKLKSEADAGDHNASLVLAYHGLMLAQERLLYVQCEIYEKKKELESLEQSRERYSGQIKNYNLEIKELFELKAGD